MSISAEQLLRDLGQNIGLAHPLVFNEQHCARLMVGERVGIDFEHLPDEQIVQMYCVLGGIPAGGLESLYRELLEANLFGDGTQGATLGLDGGQRQIVLSRALALEHMTSPTMLQVFERFINTSEHWVRRLESIGPSEKADARVDAAATSVGTSSVQSVPDHLMMRV